MKRQELSNSQMHFIFRCIAFVLVFSIVIIPPIQTVYSESITKTRLILSDMKIEQKRKIFSTSGDLLVDEQSYYIKGKIIMLRNEKFMRIVGHAFSDTEKSFISLFGIKTLENDNISTYELKGRIITLDKSTNVNLLIEKSETELKTPMLSISNKPIINDIKDIEKLNLISFSNNHANIGEQYRFSVRAYQPGVNPTNNFDQNWEYLSGVNITVTIKDNEKIVKEFHALTQSTGYYNDGFLLPDNFKTGSYTVIINATKNGYLSDSDTHLLHVLPRISHNNS